MSSVYSYDTNNQEIYTGYGQYNVEQNALITEEQLNDTEKDIRDYLEKLKSELTDYMEKLKYVSYSYYQNLSTVEQDTAQKNIDFPGRIQGLAKYYFDSYYQDALTKAMSNLNLVNSVESNLISGNARIYYLSENFEFGEHGIPVYAENFADVYPQDLFYHKINYDNSKYKWNELNLQREEGQNDYLIPHFDLNSEQENHIYHFANFVENLQKTGLSFTALGNFKAGLVDNSYGECIRGYVELNPRPNLSYFLPEILSKIKTGDILYCPTNQKTFIVKARETGLQGVRTWWNSNKTKSLMDVNKEELNYNFSVLYDPGLITTDVTGDSFKAVYLPPIRTRLKGYLNYQPEDEPQLDRITNNCVYYWDTYKENYEYGCLSIYCEEITSLALQPSIWEYTESTLFGGGDEYFNNFIKIFGSNNFITRPVIGDIIYNKISQQYRKVVRDLTKSERTSYRQTYLTEPIIQYTNGELDNSLRALATYGRGTSLFAIPKEYNICLTDKQVEDPNDDEDNYPDAYINKETQKFKYHLAQVVKNVNIYTGTENYDSTESGTTSDTGRRQALSAIIYDSKTGEIYPEPPESEENNQDYIEPYNTGRILFNTYFMLPGILQEAESTSLINTHPLRLGMVRPGDIIQYNEHSYQITTQPYLKVFTFEEAFQYLITFGYIISNEEPNTSETQPYIYNTNENNKRTALGDLLLTLFINMDPDYPPMQEDQDYSLINGFKYFSAREGEYIYCSPTKSYSFKNIDQWLGDLDNTEIVQAYALNAYNNGIILNYLDNLYHRLFTNLNRPIIVEAIPLGNDSCFGQGDSAYEVFRKTYPTSTITTVEDWLNSLKGENGQDGAPGSGVTVTTNEATGTIPGNYVTFWYQNNSTPTFAQIFVKDGINGKGITNITSTPTETGVNFTLTYGDNESTFTYSLSNGNDGISPEIQVSPTNAGYNLSIRNYGETTPTTISIKNGQGIKRYNLGYYTFSSSENSSAQYKQLVLYDPVENIYYENFENIVEEISNQANTSLPMVYYWNGSIAYILYLTKINNSSLMREQYINFDAWINLEEDEKGTLSVIKYDSSSQYGNNAPNYYLRIFNTNYYPISINTGNT